jgi:hypothetical protein
MFSALPSTDCGRAKPAGVAGGCCRSAYWGRASFGGVLVHCPADVDDVISDHAEGDPALHPDEALVAAAAEAMSALTTLMRPSQPVLHFWPLRNQRFFCSRLRSVLLVERLGMQTPLTPFAFAAASFLLE